MGITYLALGLLNTWKSILTTLPTWAHPLAAGESPGLVCQHVATARMSNHLFCQHLAAASAMQRNDAAQLNREQSVTETEAGVAEFRRLCTAVESGNSWWGCTVTFWDEMRAQSLEFSIQTATLPLSSERSRNAACPCWNSWKLWSITAALQCRYSRGPCAQRQALFQTEYSLCHSHMTLDTAGNFKQVNNVWKRSRSLTYVQRALLFSPKNKKNTCHQPACHHGKHTINK